MSRKRLPRRRNGAGSASVMIYVWDPARVNYIFPCGVRGTECSYIRFRALSTSPPAEHALALLSSRAHAAPTVEIIDHAYLKQIDNLYASAELSLLGKEKTLLV